MPKRSRKDLNETAASIVAQHTGQPLPVVNRKRVKNPAAVALRKERERKGVSPAQPHNTRYGCHHHLRKNMLKCGTDPGTPFHDLHDPFTFTPSRGGGGSRFFSAP